MKTLSIRMNELIYDKLENLSKENKLSLNKIIIQMITDSLEKPIEIYNYLESFDNKLDIISKYINKINKRQISHFKLTQQEFANRGYLANADIKDDKCLKEVLKKEDIYHD